MTLCEYVDRIMKPQTFYSMGNGKPGYKPCTYHNCLVTLVNHEEITTAKLQSLDWCLYNFLCTIINLHANWEVYGYTYTLHQNSCTFFHKFTVISQKQHRIWAQWICKDTTCNDVVDDVSHFLSTRDPVPLWWQWQRRMDRTVFTLSAASLWATRTATCAKLWACR